MSEITKYQVKDRVATITLNRPESRNAITSEQITDLIKLVRRANSDSSVKCILFCGEGEHFCAGGDVKGFRDYATLPLEERFDAFERKLLIGNRLSTVILDSPKPVIVATRGAVAGAAVSICLAADFVISSDTSYFIAAHILLGLCLDAGLSGLLPAAMGVKAAKRMALLGENIHAQEALALGICTKVVSELELDDSVRKLINRISNGPAVAMAETKSLINRAVYKGFREQCAEEALSVARTTTANTDFINGIDAMVNKNKPKFS